MIEKKIKKVIKETKEQKEKILIEENLVKNRIFAIVESKEVIDNFEFLPEGKKMKIAKNLIEEIRFLDENNILNEQLMDFLGKMFGNSLSGIVQTAVEPIVNSILGGLGLSGFFKNALMSFILKDPRRLAKALKSCNELTALVSEALVEALVMMVQEQQGMQGTGYTILRNTLLGAIQDTKVVIELQDKLEGTVCSVYNNFNKKASSVYDKLKPEVAA
jgi:hypothetical protein